MTTYKIIDFNKAQGSVIVRFADNMAPLNIDVPLTENGTYITGAELDEYIKGFIPTWHLDRINQIAAGVSNEAQIEALVQPETINTEINNQSETNQIAQSLENWQQIQAEKVIAKALVKFGLLQSDPTEAT